jgi:hypothetical protein
MKFRLNLPILTVMLIVMTVPALAHQPFFEENDLTFSNPEHIRDPTISTAIYSTLEKQDDVDYYAFEANENQSILLSITIPQIAGQDNFAPTMALIGPGLPPGVLPRNISTPESLGLLIIPPPMNATPFFEPFSRTSYWTRQEQYVKIPVNGSYLVAVWDEKGEIGRYVFVIGDREVPGGDLAFPIKMGNYWVPVVAQDNQTRAPQISQDAVAQPSFELVSTLLILAVIAFSKDRIA